MKQYSTSEINDCLSKSQTNQSFSRRDGSPFINLLMCAPLYDNRGVVRYFIGAQVDVSGLVEDGKGIESFEKLLMEERQREEGQFLRRGYHKRSFKDLRGIRANAFL